MDNPRLSRIHHGRPSRFRVALAVALALAAGACSAPGGVKQAMGKSMEAFGLKKASAPDPNAEYSIPLRLYAGDNLNAGAEKKSLALVVRIYQLKDVQRFEQAPFEAFLDEKREKDALGGDLVEVNEILMTPGQRHEVQQKMPAAASHLGVVALFRSPASSRWRFSFDGRKAVKDGITVGLHACAMTAADTAALTTVLSSPANSLSSTNCVRPGR